MNSYNEEVVVKNLDGRTLGECRMTWEAIEPAGMKPSWRGKLAAVPGKSFDFAFNTLGETVQIEGTDGWTAKVNIKHLTEGTSTNQCTFVGTGPAPRSR